MAIKIGFIGFGEVASLLSERLLQRGCAGVCAYDVLLGRDGGPEALRRRARVDGIAFADIGTVVRSADYVLSTVVTQVAVSVARDCAAHLRPGQTFVDLNSAAPSVKVEVGETVRGAGATFVEGAILGALGATGADTRILLGGPEAAAAATALNGLGLNATAFAEEIGKASTFKMLRGIFSKGLEAILVELLLAGRSAGIDRELWADVIETVTKTPFETTAANWVRTHGAACERRFHEMVQVMETMGEVGVEPVVTRGTAAFFERSAALGLNKEWPNKASSPDQLAASLQEILRTRARG